MPVKFVTLDSMPSWGALASMGSYEESRDRQEYNEGIVDRLRSMYSNDYFGSEHDRYFTSFSEGIGKHIRRISDVARKMFDTVRDISTENIIRKCNTEASLRNVPPCMYLPILTHDPIRNLLRLGRVQGYGYITPDEVDQVKDGYYYAVERNGRVNMSADNYGSKNIKMSYRHHTDIPYMTAEQIMDIRETREYIDELLATTELDPTDLDVERG